MSCFNDDNELNSLFSEGQVSSLPDATLPKHSRQLLKNRLLDR